MNSLQNYLTWKFSTHFPRAWVDKQLLRALFRLDTTRYFIDHPKLDYQPLPWVGISAADVRGEATTKRWQKIKPFLKKNKSKSIQDIGCCYGFFCISAAEELHMQAVGIDANETFLRIARFAVPGALRQNCRFMDLLVNQETVAMLPQTDATLCLSIWHHWVSNYGIKAASEILLEVWSRTNKELYFESGEEEVAEEFNLPFGKQPAVVWLEAYLNKTLKPKKIEILGQFSAGNYKHYQLKHVKRHLFRLTK